MISHLPAPGTEDSAAESRLHAVPWGPPEKRSGKSRHPDLNPRHPSHPKVVEFSHGQTKYMPKSTRPTLATEFIAEVCHMPSELPVMAVWEEARTKPQGLGPRL